MLTRALRRRLAAVGAEAEAGVSLIELLVAIGLATIVATITLLVFTSANASVNATTDREVGSAGARTTLQSWQALIQTADTAPVTNGSGQATGACSSGSTSHRFEWLTTTEILFYADLSNRSGSSASCTPPTLVWLGLRNGALLQVQYSLATLGTAFQISSCQQLTDTSTAKVSANSLFTPNPGQVLYSVDYGSAFAASSAFASATSCKSMPSSVSISSVLDTDATAVNALGQITSVGIDFTVSDSTGQHTQSFDSTVPVLGGISS